MYVFLSHLIPHSVNARSLQKYKQNIQDAFRACYENPAPLDGSLYGRIYYFHKDRTELDADNMSKPIWDALETVAYLDDRMIKLRSAGIWDLRAASIEILDLSQMPDTLFADFIQMIDEEDHILYVEVGELDYSLFRFGTNA
jgi:hypothetical protein